MGYTLLALPRMFVKFWTNIKRKIQLHLNESRNSVMEVEEINHQFGNRLSAATLKKKIPTVGRHRGKREGVSSRVERWQTGLKKVGLYIEQLWCLMT